MMVHLKKTCIVFACDMEVSHESELTHLPAMFFPLETPPRVVISPDNGTVATGNTVLFACVGYGTPNPDITWAKSGSQLSNGSRITIYEETVVENGVAFTQSILELCSAEEADAGEYSCTVANSFGNSSVNFELAVTLQGITPRHYYCENDCIKLGFMLYTRSSSGCDCPTEYISSSRQHNCDGLCGFWITYALTQLEQKWHGADK